MDTDQKEVQIKSLFRYKALSRYKGIEGKIPIVGGYTYIGLEIELENIERHIVDRVSGSTWSAVEDGSLKVRGKEFVTIPIKFKYLEMEIRRLFSGLKSPIASSRCSVHVHINVREMTTKELASFITLYSIFERSLYRFSGDRWSSNFCVPLSAAPDFPTTLIHRIKEGRWVPRNNRIAWHKYFGLNVCPIVGMDGSDTIGTVEFRHLKGTTDINLMINWINLIISLKIASKKISLEQLERMLLQMNSDSSYVALAESVFGKMAQHILNQPTFKTDVESCVTATKKFIFPVTYEKANIIIDIPKGHKLCVV